MLSITQILYLSLKVCAITEIPIFFTSVYFFGKKVKFKS